MKAESEVHRTHEVSQEDEGPRADEMHRTYEGPRTDKGPRTGEGPRANRHGRPGANSHGRPGQLLTGVAWAVLLLGLWLWGRDLSDGVTAPLTTTGDVAAVGRPLGRQAPPHAHAPVPAPATVRPTRLRIAALGMSDAAIRWYAQSPQPGEAGAALLSLQGGSGTGGGERAGGRDGVTGGRVGLMGGRRPSLSGLAPGERVDVLRSDGSTVRFAVEDVQLYDRARFEARTASAAHAAHDPGRSELRLTGETPDGKGVVVVSAYLTGYQPSGAPRG
ncbi:class F sortase [Streptomyces sp. NPDC059649]|uniref:class F sortase n=1 Tax=Streptomyces sp. NPDC059649 TaxID=3346895 RepID=UPI00369CE411